MAFKYQVEIDHFVSQGAELPALHAITDKESFRYVFANSAQQNHIPPHKLHPNRLEQQIKIGKVDLHCLIWKQRNRQWRFINIFSKIVKMPVSKLVILFLMEF